MSSAKGRARITPALTEPELNILLSLAEGERHGYAVMLETRERTGGRVAMGAGTLYGAIKRLRSRGLLEESDGQCGVAGSDRRRYYRITDSGIGALVDEIDRMRKVIRTYHAIVDSGT